MAMLMYFLCLLFIIFHSIYRFKEDGKDSFIFTPYKIDIDKLDPRKENVITKILITQYTQAAVVISINTIISALTIINNWSETISAIICIILVFVIFFNGFIVNKRIKNILG